MHNGRINSYILTGIQDKLKRLEPTIGYANGDNLLTILNLIKGARVNVGKYGEPITLTEKHETNKQFVIVPIIENGRVEA